MPVHSIISSDYFDRNKVTELNLKNKYIFDGLFGLERETLRITDSGEMSKTPHPFKDDMFSRDFCENQLEIVTPVYESIDELMSALDELDSVARKTLDGRNEYMWLNSNPPRIQSDSDIVIAKYSGAKREYREQLAKRYGKRLMLYSGIHFNFSFSEQFVQSVYDGRGEYEDFKNALYFRLSKQVFRYSWLIVLLTAASPVYDLSLDGLSGTGFDGYASRRNSEKGYWNKFVPILDYTDLHTYIDSINRYIDSGDLFSQGELYLPMRLKPEGENSPDALIKHGVNHIELRMFDVNPLAPLGIFAEDLYFAHYFLIYLTQLPDFEFTPILQETAVKNHKAAAGYDIDSMEINSYPAREAAMGLLEDMTEYFKDFPRVIESINREKAKITQNKRYCTTIYEMLKDDFQSKTFELAKK